MLVASALAPSELVRPTCPCLWLGIAVALVPQTSLEGCAVAAQASLDGARPPPIPWEVPVLAFAACARRSLCCSSTAFLAHHCAIPTLVAGRSASSASLAHLEAVALSVYADREVTLDESA